jgi:hypothetical protein
MMLGFELTASILVTRPLVPAGPMFRGFMFFSSETSSDWAETTRQNSAHVAVEINFFMGDLS